MSMALDFSTRSAQAAGPTVRPLTLTRRGRLVLLGVPVILMAVLLAGMGLFTATAQAGVDEPAGVEATIMRVQPGDSLWSVALRSSAESETGDVVAAIVELNNLKSSVLTAGQELMVPTR